MRGSALLSSAPVRSAALNAIAESQDSAARPSTRPPVQPVGLAKSFERSSIEVGVDATPTTTRLPDGRRIEDAREGVSVWWSLERLQAYLAHVKTFQPMLNVAAQTVLKRYYALQRRADTRSAARTTVRLLDSLVRLTQAHARLLRRHSALIQDAVVAVTLMETSTHAAAVIGVQSPLHATFPGDPDEDFVVQQRLVLHRLGLTGLTDDAEGGSEGVEGPANHTDGEVGAAPPAARAAASGFLSQFGDGDMRMQHHAPVEGGGAYGDLSQPSGTIAPFFADFDKARAQLQGSYPEEPRYAASPVAQASRHSAPAVAPVSRAEQATSQMLFDKSSLPTQPPKPSSVNQVAASWVVDDSFRPPEVPVAAPPQLPLLPAVRGTDWFNNPGHLGQRPAAAAFNAQSVPAPRQRGMIHEPSASIASAREYRPVRFNPLEANGAVAGASSTFRGQMLSPSHLVEEGTGMPPPPPLPRRDVNASALRSAPPMASRLVHSVPAALPPQVASALQPGPIDRHDLLELTDGGSQSAPSLRPLSATAAAAAGFGGPKFSAERSAGHKRPASNTAHLSENRPREAALRPMPQAAAATAAACFASNPFAAPGATTSGSSRPPITTGPASHLSAGRGPASLRPDLDAPLGVNCTSSGAATGDLSSSAAAAPGSASFGPLRSHVLIPRGAEDGAIISDPAALANDATLLELD